MIELGVNGTERSFDGDVASQKSKRGCPQVGGLSVSFSIPW
jgi:hypothetical protein